MEWIAAMRKAVDFIEDNLCGGISADDVARNVFMSSFYMQKGFRILTGYTVSEYIRSRRLYLAALDVIRGEKNIVDIAYDYCWETPESFTKAFTRFHGLPPLKLRENPASIRTFLPLKISVAISGGNRMDFTVEKMEGFTLIGFEREFSMEDSYKKIPEFWDEVFGSRRSLFWGRAPSDDVEKAVLENRIGEFGACVETGGSRKSKTFRYLVAGWYNGGKVPGGLKTVEVPALEWAKFKCTGPIPGALQSVNTRIFSEWLPGNAEYEIAAEINLEWYSSDGNPSDDDYRSEIWIPVRRK